MAPAAVHRGDAPRITAARAITLTNAFERNPLRFKGRLPQPPLVPDKVYINPPRPADTPADPSPVAETH
jgi:putative transposase